MNSIFFHRQIISSCHVFVYFDSSVGCCIT